MDEVVIDACCLINLYATGHPCMRSLLRGREWYISSVVIRESLYIHQAQPDGTILKSGIDIQSLIDDGSVHSCDAADGAELNLFVDFAAKIDDGEAMALAIAKSRGWTIATDDRKAIRMAEENSITVLTTPEVLKSWADATHAKPEELRMAIERIENLASFFPSSRHPLRQWWNTNAGR